MQDTNDDRIVRATVNLVTKAYIVPEYTGIKNNNRKMNSIRKILFEENRKLSGN